MKLLILHLSDMHIGKDKARICSKVQPIVDAVKNIDYDVAGALVAVTGDIASTGKEEEYLVAIDFFSELRVQLSVGLGGKPVSVFAVPGNHDCCLHPDNEVRDVMIGHLRNTGANTLAPNILDICTSVQRSFFEFRDVFAPDGLSAFGGLSPKLAYSCTMVLDTIRVTALGLNTAWISQLHEQPGTIVFPPIIATGLADADLVIGLYHHPSNWFDPSQGTRFRRAVEQLSDIVLTGHEHDPEEYTKHAHSGRSHLFLAGGVLSSPEEPESRFWGLIVDHRAALHRTCEFHLVAGHYYLIGFESPANVPWEPYSAEGGAVGGTFELSTEMAHFVDDPELNLTHRSRTSILLSDVFVAPDLREVHLDPDQRSEFVKGENLAGLLQDKPHLLLMGDDQCGKTSLAKTIFGLHLSNGDVPIWLDRDDRPPETADGVTRLLENKFCEQYSPRSLAAYQQLDKPRRVVIIDDYHEFGRNLRARQKALSLLVAQSGRIILMAHDLKVTIGDLATPGGAEGTASFSYYLILPLGYARRNDLVERWLALDETTDKASSGYVSNLVQITSTLDTLIGRSYIPAYPVYILSVLQASEAVTPVDTRASAHGYFYELFIRTALSQGTTTADFDIIASYLAHLAFKMCTARLSAVDIETYNRIHAEFEAEYDLRRPSDRMLGQLVDKRILSQMPGGRVYFKYKFTYYYFVALYLRDHIGSDPIRTRISDMTHRLYIQDNANILLFLSHLSKDPFIVKELVASASTLYADQKPAALEQDVDFLEELDELSKGFAIEDRNPREERRKMLEHRDTSSSTEEDIDRKTEELAAEEGDAAADNPLMSLNASLKTIEILGQILRNFPGSLERDAKLTILSTCYCLGLRTLASFLGVIRAESRELLQFYADYIRSVSPDAKDEEVEKGAAKCTSGLAWLIAHGLIRKVAISVGSKDLAGTYERVLNDMPTAAVKLIDTSIAIDHDLVVPTDKIVRVHGDIKVRWFPRTILAYCVVRHCQLYNVDFREKQKLATALGINHKRVIASDSSRRLIG